MSEEARSPQEQDDTVAVTVHVPLPEAPDMWVTGGGRHLSPVTFFALTHEPRADLDGLSEEDFGLVEEKITRVDKRGVEILTRFYWHPLLKAYTTGDEQSPQRNMYIRYDRARAARGILREVQFFVRDDQGRIIERILLGPKDTPLPEAAKDDYMRARHIYIQAGMKKVSKAEADYVALQRNGLDLADKLIADMEARRRQQKSNPLPPYPAAPITDDQEAQEREHRLRQALGSASALDGESQSSSVAPTDAETEGSGAPEGQSQEPAEESTSRADSSEEDEGPSPLSEALGGGFGFQDD